jgi:hypothetical protein
MIQKCRIAHKCMKRNSYSFATSNITHFLIMPFVNIEGIFQVMNRRSIYATLISLRFQIRFTFVVKSNYVRREVFMAVTMKNDVF